MHCCAVSVLKEGAGAQGDWLDKLLTMQDLWQAEIITKDDKVNLAQDMHSKGENLIPHSKGEDLLVLSDHEADVHSEWCEHIHPIPGQVKATISHKPTVHKHISSLAVPLTCQLLD